MSRVVLITGASRGIGAATARLAASCGYAVCVNYRADAQGAAAVVAEIEAQQGRAIAVQADVSDEAAVVRLFQTVDAELGPLSALVNNAGRIALQMRVADMSAERMRALFDTNVIGPFLCAREAVCRMSTKRSGAGGAIVNISSVASKYGSPGEYVDYAATKGALDTFTVGLAREVADEGIRVNAVRAGFTHTSLHAQGGEPGRVDRVKSSVPMQRGAQPAEIAEAVLWLLSSAASYTTGAIIDVAGGR